MSQRLYHARRRDRGKGFLAYCAELGILDSRKLNAEPAEMTDVGRPEEAFRICLDEIRLDAVRRSAPDCQPTVRVVVVEKHHEACLVPDEEGRAAVAQAFRRFWQRQTDRAQPCELLGDLAWRKSAHTPILSCSRIALGIRRRRRRSQRKERLRSLLLHAAARDFRRSQLGLVTGE